MTSIPKEKKPRKKQPSMAKHYCFTDFTRKEVKDWKTLSLSADFVNRVDYLIVGMEICPTTGRPHGQGYVKMIKPVRFTGAQKALVLPTTHFEIRRGTIEEAIAYCENKDPKEECILKDAKDIFEYGERPKGQGTRSDIQVGIDILKSGGGISEIAETAPHLIVKYPSGFVKLASVLLEKDVPIEREIKVYWLWGKTGTGKSHSAMYAEKDPFVMHGYQLEKGYFDNYKGQTTLIIDEFAHQCKITYLLSLLDKWKLELNVKYGSTFAQWTTVFVTSNINYPDSLYPQANDEHRAALFRRITKAVHFNKPWKEQTPIIWDCIGDESFGDIEEPDSPVSMPQSGVPLIKHNNGKIHVSRFIFDEAAE